MPSNCALKRFILLSLTSLLLGGTSAFAQSVHLGGKEKAKISAKPVSSAQFLYQSLLSEIAAQRGAFGTAVRTYLDLAQKTGDPRLAKRATELSLQSRDLELAAESARLWLNLEPESKAALQTLTAITAESPQTPEALEASLKNQLDKQAAKRGAILLQLPQMMARFQDGQANRKAIYRLTEPYLRLPEAHYVRSIAAALAQDGDTAVAEASKALELRPDWEEAAVLLWRVTPAAQQAESAKRLYEFGERYPKALEARLNYIRWLASEKRKDEAIQASAKLLADAPDNDDLRYATMATLVEVGDLDGAETLLRQLIDRSYRDVDLLKLQLGQLLEEKSQTEASLKAYAEVPAGQYFAAAAEHQARLLFKLGRLEDARRLLQDATKAQPADLIPLQLAEADILRMANKPEASFDVLELILALDPNHIEALYMSALAADPLKKYEVMEQRLRHVIELKPGYAHAYNALGYSFADRNIRLDEAERLLNKAVELAPQDAAILDSVGWLYFRQGKFEAAKEFIQKAMKRSNDPEITQHYIEILWNAGQKDEARALFKAQQQLEPSSDLLKKLGRRLGL